ncbi:MAG: galactokinase [Bacteroidia bacterium]|nr:galactokinase [Bacteroidia bacterium]
MPNQEILSRIQAYFSSKENSKEINFYRAPGRINLIGEHLDYNDGFVMPAAIDKSMYFGVSASEKENSYIYSLDYDTGVELKAGNDLPSWAKYFEALLDQLSKRGKEISAVHCAFSSDLPIGAGLSSSAALCCGFLTALNEMQELGLSKKDIVLTGQAAEHAVGIKCGIMDQYAVTFGKKDQVIMLDCNEISHSYFPAELGDYQLILINSNVEHALVDGAYNRRREASERAFAIVQAGEPHIKTYRDLDKETLAKYKRDFSPEQRMRSRYVVDEISRVKDAGKALNDGNIKKLGQLLFETHQGLSIEYEVSCPELDLLVSLAKKHHEVIGARMMGGGFGGCTLNLIKKDKALEIAGEIAAAYKKKTGLKPEIIEVNIENGVEKVEEVL